jgi:hypothetical protein
MTFSGTLSVEPREKSPPLGAGVWLVAADARNSARNSPNVRE